MKRNTLNFWIDILTFLVFLVKIWTGLLIHYVLPAGQGRGKSLLLWGLNRHDYGVIHFYLALAMIVLVLVHLWLHWSWVCSTLGRLVNFIKLKPEKYSSFGIASLFLIMIITISSLYCAKSQVVNTADRGSDHFLRQEEKPYDPN